MLPSIIFLLVASIAGSIAQKSGSSCPEGWFPFRDSCYYVEKGEKKNFHQARFSCEAQGAHLFVPNDYAEWEFVRGRATENSFTWIGLWDNDQTLVYDPQWDTYGGMNIDNLPWLVRGPGHGHTLRAHCIWYFWNKSTNFVNYAPCVATRHEYVCEYNSTDVLVPRGGDSRLLPNKAPYYKLIKEQSQPRPRPQIQTNLDDVAGNQISRYSSSGSDSACPEGQLSYLSSCIYVERNTQLSFADAQRACQDVKATLWVPNDAEEWATVTSYLDPFRQYWIGLADNGLTPDFDPVWQNINGMDMNQLPWQLPLLPNKGHYTTQDCVRVFTNTVLGDLVHWAPCIYPMNYICENDREYPTTGSDSGPQDEYIGGSQSQSQSSYDTQSQPSYDRGATLNDEYGNQPQPQQYNGDVATCPPEWFPWQESCYYIERSQARSFTDAQEFCSRLDSTLFVSDSDSEWKYVTSRAESFRNTWIGLTANGGPASDPFSGLGSSLGSLGQLAGLTGLGGGNQLAGNLQSSQGFGLGSDSGFGGGGGSSGLGGLGGLSSLGGLGGLGSLGGLGNSGLGSGLRGGGLPAYGNSRGLGAGGLPGGGAYNPSAFYSSPVTSWETTGGISPSRLPWFVSLVPNNGYVRGLDCVSYMKTLIGEGVQWSPCNTWSQFVCEYNATAVPTQSAVQTVDNYKFV